MLCVVQFRKSRGPRHIFEGGLRGEGRSGDETYSEPVAPRRKVALEDGALSVMSSAWRDDFDTVARHPSNPPRKG